MNRIYIVRLLKEIQDIMVENRDYLIELDSVVGDSDLGLTMSDGFAAAYKAAADSDEMDIGKLLYNAGKTMSTAVPSTMGTLMASGLMQAGKVLKGRTELTDTDIADIFKAYLEGVANRGKAKVGEKTFLDGFDPAVTALKEALNKGDTLADGATKAREAAEKGFKNTTNMVAVHGRAATRGEASRTLEDPGAAVAMLIMKAFENSTVE
ncbi:MAG: dihydroxyacetone kinase subunit DhaL [Anaerocolumna aminovalerica]|uniref:dihydroxyacetone kinase subunit DhaL n=1 Tax=Anaerocolumna aminovalerica TaxID=1527 RepID=UPI002911237E|nr:dihydroxyacetone kinase subunit DhaL [Anaerocolumna aminovalerica]MDU6263212.1 dihydroxyacetone kinase subunit DhaL [Anaerocolumna aminovalerica]